MDPDVPDLLVSFARTHTAIGRATPAEVVDETVDYLDGMGDPEEIRGLARVAVADALAEHLREQAGWPARTDNDRLTAAFAELNAAGVLAREDFACCDSCGHAEIGGEVPPGASPHGFAFYHYQDTEHAVEGDSILLAFGGFDGRPTADVGAEIAETLRRNGLTVQWSGDPGRKIDVAMTWRRRRDGEFATPP